jgi:predicted nuclease of predicted toxin-antitoxin system
MAGFLANENVPGDAVAAARAAGFDIAWISEIDPGASDPDVLRRAQNEQRVLVTLDKDFGELAFRQGATATCGVILLRPKLRSPDYVARFLVAVLGQSIDWVGNFAVAQDSRIRVLKLPP